MTPRAQNFLAVAARTVTTGALAASLTLTSAAAQSDNNGDRDIPAGRNPLAGGITEMVAMPGGPWRAARVGDGDAVYFVSGNGRWVVRGEAYDLWQGERLAGFEAVRASTRVIRLDGLGAIWDQLDPVTFGAGVGDGAADIVGAGVGDVVVFVDPRCPACEGLIDALKGHSARYRIVVLQIPLLGEASGRIVKAVHCAADRDDARAAVRDRAPATALAQRPDCDGGAILRRLTTAQMIGLQGVPFMIHPDGRFIEGVPADLAAWLEGR